MSKQLLIFITMLCLVSLHVSTMAEEPLIEIRSLRDWEDQLKFNKWLVVEFTDSAENCTTCKLMHHGFEALAHHIYKNLKFEVVNISEDQSVAEAAGVNVKSLPSFVFLRNGVIEKVIKGVHLFELGKEVMKYDNAASVDP